MNIKSFLLGFLFALLTTFTMVTTGEHNKDVIDLNKLESIAQEGDVITLTTTSGDSYQLVKQLAFQVNYFLFYHFQTVDLEPVRFRLMVYC